MRKVEPCLNSIHFIRNETAYKILVLNSVYSAYKLKKIVTFLSVITRIPPSPLIFTKLVSFDVIFTQNEQIWQKKVVLLPETRY